VGARDEAFLDNQEEFKRANERLARALADVVRPEQAVPFLCECAEVTCTRRVDMTISEYREMRAHSRRFAIVPGHATLTSARVVAENDRYQVVEKPDD
jgi:hypothetical protein